MIRAVFFDLGGVIVRTEFQTPRQRLAERLGMDYEGIIEVVYGSESSRQASLGVISEDEHWADAAKRLHLSTSEIPTLRDEFFAGDAIDRNLIQFMHELHKTMKVGLISNAWSGLRPWIEKEKFEDVFDAMIISAEVGVMKPNARIYHIALEKFGVEAAEVVFLDDFAENIEGARAVGMTAIHFTQPEKALDELKMLLANHR